MRQKNILRFCLYFKQKDKVKVLGMAIQVKQADKKYDNLIKGHQFTKNLYKKYSINLTC